MFDDGDNEVGRIGNHHMTENRAEEELMMEEELDIHDTGKAGNYNLTHDEVQEATTTLEHLDTDNSDARKAEGHTGFDNEDIVDKRMDRKLEEDKQVVHQN